MLVFDRLMDIDRLDKWYLVFEEHFGKLIGFLRTTTSKFLKQLLFEIKFFSFRVDDSFTDILIQPVPLYFRQLKRQFFRLFKIFGQSNW